MPENLGLVLAAAAAVRPVLAQCATGKHPPRRRWARMIGVVAASLCALATGGSVAGDAPTYPVHPIRIVVGHAPGSGPDKLARLVAEQLTQLWRASVVVENRTGAGATIAADLVAKAHPDGYTLLMGSQSSLASAYATNPDLRYNPLTDFATLGRLAQFPSFLVVNTAVPVRTMTEVIAYARAHPAQLTFASFGSSTVTGLVFGRLLADTGVDIVEIPYRDTAAVATDLLAGRVDLALFSYWPAQQYAAEGRLRVLAATSSRRAAFANDIATAAEQGFPGFRIETWYGLVAPAGVAPEILARLREALTQIQHSAETRRLIEQFGAEPIVDDAAQFAAVLRAETEEFSRLAKQIGKAAKRESGANPP